VISNDQVKCDVMMMVVQVVRPMNTERWRAAMYTTEPNVKLFSFRLVTRSRLADLDIARGETRTHRSRTRYRARIERYVSFSVLLVDKYKLNCLERNRSKLVSQ
jgi:hypothetical protein